ncbi:MAG: hypothetical protein NVSMB66_6570 [Candidatus Doudnabacteria bacterium]
MHYHIISIPHPKQRYDTVGDYYKNGQIQEFRISEMDEDYMFLVTIHEMIEEYLSRKRGIKEKDITKFDKQFEKERLQGKHSEDAEPGHDPKAPYRKEHMFAEKIERLVARELGVSWKEYDKTVVGL